MILLNAFQKNPRTLLNENLNLINAIYGFCEINLKRRDLFLKYSSPEIKEDEKLNIVIDSLYFGFNKYRAATNNELIKVNSFKIRIIKYIIHIVQ